MKFNFEETKIYVRPGATDLRKGVGEEALKVIEKQKQELQKKESELQKQHEKIIKARVEIERLNDQLAIKRAREFAARSEKSSLINSDQKELPFDIGQIIYTYTVESTDENTNNLGCASLSFKRNSKNDSPYALLGYSIDVQFGKKVSNYERKVSKNGRNCDKSPQYIEIARQEFECTPLHL